MKFNDSFIDQVRNSVSLVDLVGRYVHLKKKGKDFAALCPFHAEKTPSFLVSESKQIFKCFGCGAGGDIFKFVVLIENLNFPESVRHLAESYGIPLPQTSEGSRLETETRQLLFKIMASATSFFSRCLGENIGARQYLEDRDISPTTVERFAVGYAPAGQKLLDSLKAEGYSLEQIAQCGLSRESDQGQPYDKFRNRIMFPIRDLSGRTIAFGGRVLGDGIPKYLNSPETPLYNKSHNLYPLEITREEIRRRDFAILVEGYFDCVVPFQFGVQNIVASLGTSLTESQARLLSRYTRNVITNFDPDTAGTSAAVRSIDLFLEQGFRINILQLPEGRDPDTYIRQEGVEAYRGLLKSSQSYLDFLVSHFMSLQKDAYSPKGKQEVLSEILPYLAKVPNKIERAEYSTRIAGRLRVDENLLLQELGKIPVKQQERLKLSQSVQVDPVTPAETTLLIALLDAEWTAVVIQALTPDLLEGLRSREIFLQSLKFKELDRNFTPATLSQTLEDETDRHLLEEMALRSQGHPISNELILGSIQALRKKQLERMSRQVQHEIAEAERENSHSEIERLLTEKERLRRELRKEEAGLDLTLLLSPEDARK